MLLPPSSTWAEPAYSAQARLEAADAKSEPSMQPLTVLREVDLICHLWQRYVTMALLPLASSSVTVRREMVVFNNQAVSRIEGGANQVTQKLADSKYNIAFMSLVEPCSHLCGRHHHLVVHPARETEAYRLQAQERRSVVRAGEHRALLGMLRNTRESARCGESEPERKESRSIPDRGRRGFPWVCIVQHADTQQKANRDPADCSSSTSRSSP